jgi:hypothetical protein
MNGARRADNTEAGGKTKVIWDDSKVRNHHPNVIHVSGGREEIILSFGRDPHLGEGPDEETAQLSDQIVMSPFTAKRLGRLLDGIIGEYESKYGSLDVKPWRATGPDQESSLQPNFSRTKISDEKIGLLLQLVKNLDVEVGLERSFKVSDHTLLGNRFLLGTSKGAISLEPHERILHICKRMDMPENFLETFKENLAQANYVHFGFEENVTSCIYKVYLEFYEEIEKEIKIQPDKTDPFLLHLGFKWDASDNTKQALTRYTWYPQITIEDILVRLSNILDPHSYKVTLEIAKDIVSMASSRVPHNAILYLEVSEEDNPRRSFDINMYRANLQLRELYPFLLKMCGHYSIPSDQFHALYEQSKSMRFGHLSGGIDREGRDFLTVYYGVEGYYIRDSQSKYESLPEGVPPTIGPDKVSSVRSPFSTKGLTAKKADLLLHLVENLDVQYGFERSFKISAKTLLANRFLLGFKRNEIRQQPHERIVDICERIDMPEDFIKAFQQSLPEANIVLFGFEENESTSVLKAYLEFGGRFREVFKDNPENPNPFVIHLGFKWDASDNSRRTLAQYTCYPSISVKKFMTRISSIYDNNKYRNSFDIVKSIVDLASSRIGQDQFLYVEVKEENNPRRSFDINTYRAKLALTELYPSFLKICQHYSIPPEEFRFLYEPVKNQIFGHMSGGIDREGRDFLTLYFREKGIPK